MEQEGGMSRLIDEAEAIKRIKDYTGAFNENGYYTRNDLIVKAIRETPTAYDVEAVVRELEDYAMWKELMIYDLTYRERMILENVIEIVKRGGKIK